MKEALVSICIPVYNGAAYLNACLDSVFEQTLPDYEVIVVDDCSSDTSAEIIDSYKKKNSRLKYFRNEKNQGLVGNWNRCLELASGTWIKFVFQDDLLARDCLEKMTRAGEGASMVVSRRRFLIEDSASETLRTYFTGKVLTIDTLFEGSPPEHMDSKILSSLALQKMGLNFIGEPSAVCFKRSLLGETGLFDPEFGQLCDLEFWLRIVTRDGMIYLNEELVSFRVHGSSETSANITGKVFVSRYADPALLSHKMLYDPVFSNFRKGLSGTEQMRLLEYHRLKIYEGYRFLKQDEAAAALPQAMKFRKFPDYLRFRKASLKTKVLSGLMKLKRMMNFYL